MELSGFEINVLISLYMVLIQSCIDWTLVYSTDDDIAFNGGVGASAMLEAEHLQLAVSTAALHDYKLTSGLICFYDGLRYWVKPRSTIWFSDFFMAMYDDNRWIKNFRMNKATVAEISFKLRGCIAKTDTNYRLAVPVEVRVCACLYKLAHGANLLTCSEHFGIGRFTVGLVLREVVTAIISIYRNTIEWPTGGNMQQVMLDFKAWCGLPSVQGAIDCTHIRISKPRHFPEDYYYYKTGGYTIVAQAVVDSRKLFTYLFVGLPGSVNNQRVLCRSALWQEVMHRGLMSTTSGSQDGFPPYLLTDKGYLLLSWMMTPFKDDGQPRSLAESLYNRKHRRGRSVVENAFSLMKENWREMLNKCTLDVAFVSDVVYACCILHNLTIRKGTVDFEALLRRIALQAEHEVRLRQQGDWRWTAQEEEDYNNRLGHGEIPGEELRQDLVYYVAVQPGRQ